MSRALTAREVADRLGVTERTVRNLVYQRRIPFIQIGRAVRFKPEDVDRFIAENTTEARP